MAKFILAFIAAAALAGAIVTGIGGANASAQSVPSPVPPATMMPMPIPSATPTM